MSWVPQNSLGRSFLLTGKSYSLTVGLCCLPWWTLRIFFIFFCSAGGRGSPRRREGGKTIFYWKSQEGVSPERVGAGGWGAGSVFAGNLGGGGLSIFFGAESPAKLRSIGLVFVTYGWKSVLSFLLMVEDRSGLFYLRFAPVRELGLVFFTYRSSEIGFGLFCLQFRQHK